MLKSRKLIGLAECLEQSYQVINRGHARRMAVFGPGIHLRADHLHLSGLWLWCEDGAEPGGSPEELKATAEEELVWRRRKTRDRREEKDGRGEEGHALGGRPGLRALIALGYADQTKMALTRPSAPTAPGHTDQTICADQAVCADQTKMAAKLKQSNWL